ncbi:MAG: hypothetical protein B6D57_00800 [Candidatus Coatesbacteria bacterium 4484_99]|uniref:Lipopolysaccharide heptosyltransferase II n=1 Tax=Candidatus Coatesbacteria bacterium 4484_99 TaxID=1970774 RepID=A0A1W9S2U9_9BACT|nr:MAG: hypothetical protein B6D57_00800 [Candidatus Coatesbacteria bacterium 4484_99]RLC39405.1 MAG: hypothetical protein DRH51_07160 [Candidatus Coatesbacteria bacterium]
MPFMIENLSSLAGRAISPLISPFKNRTKRPQKVKKILVVKIWATGEVLLTTPALRTLRRLFPNAEINYLTGIRSSPIIATNPNINRILTVDESIFISLNPIKIMQLMLDLRKQDYDLCILFHHSFAFALIFRIICSGILAGINRRGEGALLNYSTEYDETIHQADEYLNVVLSLGGKPEDKGLEIFLTEKVTNKVEKQLKDAGISEKYIVIAPGGGDNPKTKMPNKLMPINKWNALVQKLCSLSIPILIIGSKSDRKRARILASLSSNITDITGKTTIPEVSAVIKCSRLLITNDSLPLHISSAFKTPTIVIFGPTNPVRYGPYKNDNSIIISPRVKCAPCYRDGYLENCVRMICWEDIDPEEIMQFVKEKLNLVR